MQRQQQFEATPFGVRQARQWVTAVLFGHVDLGGAAELVVSELTSNVERHTPDETFTVAVGLAPGGTCRIAVSGGVETDLRITAAEGDEESGRGLAIIEALAHRWGVERTPGGECVWVELLPLP